MGTAARGTQSRPAARRASHKTPRHVAAFLRPQRLTPSSTVTAGESHRAQGAADEKEVGSWRVLKFLKFVVAIGSQLGNPLGVKFAAPNAPESHPSMTLNQAGVGCDLEVEVLSGPGCERLRELGFCERSQVRKLAGGRNLLCSVCGTRLAISRELAEQVLVKAAG